MGPVEAAVHQGCRPLALPPQRRRRRHKNTINYIKAQILSWFGHLHQMPEERMVKRVYKWKLMLTRPLGRPKNRWEDDIINDMKKLKTKNWTSCIQDCSKWKLYVEKGKTFKD
jgi:hypothetical protein